MEEVCGQAAYLEFWQILWSLFQQGVSTRVGYWDKAMRRRVGSGRVLERGQQESRGSLKAGRLPGLLAGVAMFSQECLPELGAETQWQGCEEQLRSGSGEAREWRRSTGRQPTRSFDWHGLWLDRSCLPEETERVGKICWLVAYLVFWQGWSVIGQRISAWGSSESKEAFWLPFYHVNFDVKSDQLARCGHFKCIFSFGFYCCEEIPIPWQL